MASFQSNINTIIRIINQCNNREEFIQKSPILNINFKDLITKLDTLSEEIKNTKQPEINIIKKNIEEIKKRLLESKDYDKEFYIKLFNNLNTSYNAL